MNCPFSVVIGISIALYIRMMRTLRLAPLLFCILAAGCASPYKEFSGGPTAYLRFVDNMGPGLGPGGRRAGLFIYDDENCSEAHTVPQHGWVAVPANKPINIQQFFDTRGAGMIQGYCGVWSSITLQEGQYVQMSFDFQTYGLRWRCRSDATEYSTTGERLGPIQLNTPTSESCKDPSQR